MRSTRARVLAAGLAAVAVAAAVTVVVLAEPRQVGGFPRATGAGPGEEVGEENAEPHAPEEVAAFPPETYPKDYGPVSTPDVELIEIQGDIGYFAYTTFKIVHLTAVDLTNGEVRWTGDINLDAPLGPLSMVATETGLLVSINASGYTQFTISLDPETGDEQWQVSETPWTITGVVRDRLLIFDSDQDAVHAFGLDDPTTPPLWSVPADGGRVTEVYQETAGSRLLPRDGGDALHQVDVGANPAEDQYIVHAAMYSGAIAVRDLATGTVVSEGNAGEKMVDVVAYEDTVYAYRQTPRTLAAYSITDLSSPKWTVQTPSSGDGSDMGVCAENLVCLLTWAGRSPVLYGIDATTGETRWETDDYVLSTVPAMAGGSVVVTHTNGTALLDPATGTAVAEFDAPAVALPGDDEIIGFDGGEIQLVRPDAEPLSLGEAPDQSMVDGACEWTSEVALCAGAEGYQLWRYR